MELSNNKTYIFSHIVLALFVFLCFRAGVDNFFAGDDFGWLFVSMKTLHHPFYILRSHDFFLEAHNHYIRFTELSYFIVNLLLTGTNPISYHLSAILIHVLNVVLVSYFFSRLCGNRLAGLLGAIFWGLNYKHVEVVFRTYAVADSLVLLFYLSAFLLFLNNQKILAIVCFIISLFAKESTVIFPLLMTVYVVWFIKDDRKKWLKRTIPFWIAALLFTILVRYMGNTGYISVGWDGLSRFWDLMLSYVGPDAVYVKQVWLAGKPYLIPGWVAGILFVIFGIVVWKIPRVYRFGLAWMSIMMLPTLFVVHQTSRYHYLPLVGLGLIVGQGGYKMLRYFQKKKSQTVLFYTVFTLVIVYFIIGINLEEQYYALYGEIHRHAAESFKQKILPTMPKDAHAVAVFFKQDSKKWAEDLYAQFLLNPWYLPGTYKWVYRRHQAILGLSNTYGFVSFCAYNDVNTLFVRVPYEEFRNRLLSGDFYIIIHDYATNTFRFGADSLKPQFIKHIDNRDFYNFLQPGRFDPTNTGPLYF